MYATRFKTLQNFGCLTLGFVTAMMVTIGMTVVAGARPQANNSSIPRPDVTLRSTSENSRVQMLDGFAIDSHVVRQFPDGTHCFSLDGPLAVNINDTYFEVYRLECDGKRGYVHAKWVQLE